MQFLSIAVRELRVAAKKRSSFRVRMLTSCIALVISGFSLWLVTLLGGRRVSGEELFFTLTWVSFLCACLTGPALTADCVNEERNDGTLGLLFLTNLPASSITIGKLFGHGLLAIYSILSVVPVMALPALLGGTDGASLAKTALVFFVTVLLSLVAGMLASTVCRRTWVAALAAICFLVCLGAGIPVASEVLRSNQQGGWAGWLELLSPSYSLAMAAPSAVRLSSNHLWLALSLQASLALALFGLATFFLARAWREGKSGRRVRWLNSVRDVFRYGGGEARRRLRRRLLGINPILWLSCRDRFGPLGTGLVLVIFAFVIARIGHDVRLGPNNDFIRPLFVLVLGLPLLYAAFCFRLAAAASERFAADRKAGALELILCTPMPSAEIIRGHWLGLIRRFSAAGIGLLVLHAFALNYIVEAIRIEARIGPFSLHDALVKPVRHILGVARIPNEVAPFYIACLAVLTAAILIVILWIALVWLGTALSLTLRREIFAPWIALFLLALPPIPLFVIAVALLDNKKLFASDLFLALLRLGASGFFIVLANALVWLFLARRWTYRKLRGVEAHAESRRARRKATPGTLAAVRSPV